MELDDNHDAEERRVTRFLSSGCNCQLSDGSPCALALSAPQLQAVFYQLTRDQLDILVMGQLRTLYMSE